MRRGGTSRPRGNSVRQDTPCHTRWQTPRSPTHLPQGRTDHNTATAEAPHHAELPTLRKVVLLPPFHAWGTTLWLKNSAHQHKRADRYNFLDWFSSQNHREQPRRLHSDTQSEGASTIFRSKSCALPSRKGKCTQLSGVSEHALPDQELDEMDHKD